MWDSDGGHTPNESGGTDEGFYRYGIIEAGIYEMVYALEKMGRDVDEEVTTALECGADIIVDAQRALAPVDKSTVKNAIKRWKPYKNKQGQITVRCGIDFHTNPKAKHAIYQEFGRQGGINEKGVEIGHMSATPFIRPGFAYAKDIASDVVVKKFNELIEKNWGGK